MRRICVMTLAAATLLGSVPALAKDLYVRAGSKGTGTRASPYNDVDDALRDAFSGDVVHVAAGDYFGPGNSGKFTISKPNLTLVGGYNADFSERDPFKNISRLIRGEDPDPKMCRKSPRCTEIVKRQKVPQTKASYNAKGLVVGEGDHTGFVLDGFVIDGYTRHMYKPNEDLNLSLGPIGTPCLSFNKPGVKVRNSIVVNCAGPGILMNALGTKLPSGDARESGDDWAEVSNTLVINSIMQGLEFRIGNMDPANAPDGGCALLKNNTLVFTWESSGENYNLIQGRQTQLTLKDNVLAFAGLAINNGFGNRFGRFIGNAFGAHSMGAYRYMDESGSKATLVLDDVTQLEGEACKKKYACSKQSTGNVLEAPKFKKLDTFFFDKFMNQIASEGGGKVTMDSMNQWRSMLGMPLQGSKGTGKMNYAPIYDPGADWSNLMLFAENLEGKGAQRNGLGGKFQEYKSASGASTGGGGGGAAAAPDLASLSFTDVKWADLGRGKPGAAALAGKADGMYVKTVLKVGDKDASSWYMPDETKVAADKGWLCFRDKNREIFLYVAAGSEALAGLEQARKEGSDLRIKGKAYDIGAKLKATGRVGIIVLATESNSDD